MTDIRPLVPSSLRSLRVGLLICAGATLSACGTMGAAPESASAEPSIPTEAAGASTDAGSAIRPAPPKPIPVSATTASPRMQTAVSDKVTAFDRRLAEVQREVEQVKHFLMADAPVIAFDEPEEGAGGTAAADGDGGALSSLDTLEALYGAESDAVEEQGSTAGTASAVADLYADTPAPQADVDAAPRRPNFSVPEECDIDYWQRQRFRREGAGPGYDPIPQAPCRTLAVPFGPSGTGVGATVFDSSDPTVPLLFPVREDFGLPRPPQPDGPVRRLTQDDRPADPPPSDPQPLAPGLAQAPGQTVNPGEAPPQAGDLPTPRAAVPPSATGADGVPALSDDRRRPLLSRSGGYMRF